MNTITEEDNETECLKKLNNYIKESLSENELRQLESVLKEYQECQNLYQKRDWSYELLFLYLFLFLFIYFSFFNFVLQRLCYLYQLKYLISS